MKGEMSRAERGERAERERRGERSEERTRVRAEGGRKTVTGHTNPNARIGTAQCSQPTRHRRVRRGP